MNLLLLESHSYAHFTKLEIFALIISCAIHDVDHPGVANSFLVASSHPIAILYNDTAVLESHHVSRAYEISRMSDMNVFSGLNSENYKQCRYFRLTFREIIVAIVLATDLAQHFTLNSKFKGKIAATVSLENEEDRHLILKMAIKCGDLGNPTKPFEIAKKWTGYVMEEFFRQV